MLSRHFYRTVSVAALFAAAGVAFSDARTLAGAETQALAIDFTDDFFQATTGQYGSAYILDTTTPANNYDSHPYGKLTYTSPSLKMCRQADGLLKFGPHNLFLHSEAPSNAAWSKTSCTVSGSVVTFTGATLAKHINQPVTVVLGSPYTFSVEVTAGTHSIFQLVNNGDGQAYANFNLSAGTVGTAGTKTTASITDLGSGKYRITAVFASSVAFGTQFRVYGVDSASATYAQTTASTGNFTLHSGHLRRGPSVDTYLATTTAVATGLPYEWDASGNPLGLLVEEARTNLALRSEEFENAAWTEESISTITSGSVVSPSGTTNAETITASASTAAHDFYSTAAITSASGSNFAFSIYVKKNTHQYVFITQTATGSTGIGAVFDLDGADGPATQTHVGATSGTIVSTSMTSEANGWKRITIVGNMVSVNRYLVVGFAGAATGNTTLAAGSFSCTTVGTESFYVWGAQYELGSFPTSYIQTVAATVARAADNITMETSAFPFSATAGTLMVDYIPDVIVTGNGIASIFLATTETIELHADVNNHLRVVNGGSPQALIDADAVTAGADTRHAAAWSANNFNASLNGVLGTLDSSGSVPTGLTTFAIGRRVSTTTSLATAHIRKVLFVPRRVSDGDLPTFGV